jgi:hypothetical protein
MAPEHLWFNFMIDQLPHPAVIIDGFAGGNILGLIRKFSPEEMARLKARSHEGFDWYLDGMIRKSAKPQIANIFREKYQHDLVNLCPENLKRSFREFPAEALSLSGFVVANRSRRPITAYMFGMLSRKADSHCPFLENEFYDFVQSIPPEFRANYLFYEAWRKAMFPSIADIPTLKSMAPEKYVSKEVYHSFRNSNVIEYLMTLLDTFIPPSEFIDHRKAMNYLFYETRMKGQQDHYHRTIFLRNYLVFVIWCSYYLERGAWEKFTDRLSADLALPLLRLKNLL